MKFYLPFELPFNKRQFIYLLKGVYDLHFKLKTKAKRERTLSKQTKHSQSHSLIGIIVAQFESTEVA